MCLVMRTRATLMHSTEQSRRFQHVCKFCGDKLSSAMKVNAEGMCHRLCVARVVMCFVVLLFMCVSVSLSMDHVSGLCLCLCLFMCIYI